MLPFKERQQMAPVTGLYKLSFLSAKGHLNWLNRVVNSSGNKYMPIFLSLLSCQTTSVKIKTLESSK